MKLKEFLRKIDAMDIYEKDFDTILNLLNNTNDRFFVKVMEEVVNGNLFFSDFERVFQDESYAEILKTNLEAQKKLENDITKLVEFRRNILLESNYTNEAATTKIGMTQQFEGDQYKNFYSTQAQNTVKELYYQLFDSTESESDIVKAAKIKIYDTIFNNQGELTRDDMLFFKKSQILPIDFSYQILNRSDLNFMIKYSLTEDEMKKIKALSIFLKRNNVG
jgi:hypothetical protein